MILTEYYPKSDSKILASLGFTDYTQTLKGLDLSNLLYVYSAKDEQLGDLTEQEKSFVKQHGGHLLETGWTAKHLGHSSMLIDTSKQKIIIDFLRQDDVMKSTDVK